jgi:uncharacterized protein (DUF2225 family)
MSGRIRKLDAELYKNNRFVKNRHVPRFAIPMAFQTGHAVRPPRQDADFLIEYKQACPICGKAVTIKELKRNILRINSFDMDCRITYKGCNPLWLEVIHCPNCYYANHYLKFFGINNFEYEVVEDLIQREHKHIVEARLDRRSDYDWLVIRYLQAININEHINPGANALIGGLWRNLYWMSKDITDNDFAQYCLKKAVEKYKTALEKDEITNTTEKSATALSLAALMSRCGETREILPYLEIAVQSPDERVKENAMLVKNKIDSILRRNSE